MAAENGPITALVEYQIRPENVSMEEWLAEWQHRGVDALQGEPETTAYAACVSVDDPDNVLIFERYANGQASLDKHIERPAHDQLMRAMGQRKMTKRRVMSTRFPDLNFSDLNSPVFNAADHPLAGESYGYWSRPALRAALTDAGPVITLLGLRFADAQARDGFLEITQTHADYCWDAEPDTLIYSGGIVAADGDRGPDIKSGDLIFVMVCTDDAAAVRHNEDSQHVAIGQKMIDRGIEMESTFMRQYRASGMGYLWAAAGRPTSG